MNKRVAVILVSLLGFLGCSDSNDGTSTFSGEAIPVAPFGIIETSTPTYEWTPVPWATKYRLWVQDTNETVVIDEWYTAEEARCESEDGLCMAKPVTWVLAPHEFKVQACANEECGMWSSKLYFDSSPTPLAYKPRFTDNGDGTVYDHNTGLTWTKNASYTEPITFERGTYWCGYLCQHAIGQWGRWRVPTLTELASLRDDNAENGDGILNLPPGHPFIFIAPPNVYYPHMIYWTSTPYNYWWENQGAPPRSYLVDFDGYRRDKIEPRSERNLVWCVYCNDCE